MIRKDPAGFTPEDIAVMAQCHREYGGRPLVTKNDLPTLEDYFDHDGAQWLQGKVYQSRYKELEEGAEPTAAELRKYVEVWLASVAAGDYDSDIIPTCGVSSYENANGEVRYAVICSTGYSFSEVRHRLKKADFTSLEDAIRYVHELTDTTVLLK